MQIYFLNMFCYKYEIWTAIISPSLEHLFISDNVPTLAQLLEISGDLDRSMVRL